MILMPYIFVSTYFSFFFFSLFLYFSSPLSFSSLFLFTILLISIQLYPFFLHLNFFMTYILFSLSSPYTINYFYSSSFTFTFTFTFFFSHLNSYLLIQSSILIHLSFISTHFHSFSFILIYSNSFFNLIYFI